MANAPIITPDSLPDGETSDVSPSEATEPSTATVPKTPPGHVSIPTATMVRVCISEGVPIPVDTLTSEWISPVNVASVRFGLKTVKLGVESVGAVRPFLWNQIFLWLDGFAHFEIPLTVKCQNATLCVPREGGSFSDTRQYSPRKINTHPSQIDHGTQSSSPVTTPSFSLSVVLWVEMLHFMSVGTAHWC